MLLLLLLQKKEEKKENVRCRLRFRAGTEEVESQTLCRKNMHDYVPTDDGPAPTDDGYEPILDAAGLSTAMSVLRRIVDLQGNDSRQDIVIRDITVKFWKA